MILRSTSFTDVRRWWERTFGSVDPMRTLVVVTLAATAGSTGVTQLLLHHASTEFIEANPVVRVITGGVGWTTYAVTAPVVLALGLRLLRSLPAGWFGIFLLSGFATFDLVWDLQYLLPRLRLLLSPDAIVPAGLSVAGFGLAVCTWLLSYRIIRLTSGPSSHTRSIQLR